MKLIDLTLEMPVREERKKTVKSFERRYKYEKGIYTAVQHVFSFGSTIGTYIDFPGHVKEADDGLRAIDYPVEKLFRVKTAVIHLDRKSKSGAVSAADLAAAAPKLNGCKAIVLNALGKRRFDGIKARSVWLTPDAGEWLASKGIHLFVSDIYEREPDFTGIFAILFKAGISTVCWPVNLHKLTSPYVELTALPIRFKDVTQVQCRIVAEF